MNFLAWSIRWGVPFAAIADLRTELGLDGGHFMHEKAGASESAVGAQLMLEASEKGVELFRNNVGVLEDVNGRPVRYGLANVNKAQNEIIKSGDYIGWRKEWIATPQYVARFVSRETKGKDWVYTGTDREVAQLRWAMKVNHDGGDATFANGRGTL